MDLTYYIDKIKFELTGGVLNSEITDENYAKLIDLALEELNRYYDATQLIETTASRCIDLKKLEEDNNIVINTVSAIYRTKPNGVTTTTSTSSDPMLIAAWNIGNNFNRYGTGRWIYNYSAYNTSMQISNTLSTDLDFKEDKLGKKLYVNFTNNIPDKITIEYIPRLNSVEEVVGNYWIDILSRMALAYAKITLGRIRSRYKQSDALWEQDGDALLEEGKTELNGLRERLQNQANFTYPLD